MINLPQIVVGVECNTPENELADVKMGIVNLSKCDAVKGVMVSTGAGDDRIEMFAELRELCLACGMGFIPGLKVSRLFETAAEAEDPDTGKMKQWNAFDSHMGWVRLAHSIALACDYAQLSSVCLDLESASRGYIKGIVDKDDPQKTCEIDVATLVYAIEQLPRGPNTWIYPTFTYVPEANPVEHDRQRTIVQALKTGHGDITLIDTSLGAPSTFYDPRIQGNVDKLRVLAGGRPMARKIWMYNDGKYWRDAEVLAVMLEHVMPPDFALIYTGLARFVEGTEILATLLNILSGKRSR